MSTLVNLREVTRKGRPESFACDDIQVARGWLQWQLRICAAVSLIHRGPDLKANGM